MTTYRFRELTDEQVANWHNTPPAARKAAILEEMGMDSKKINAASQAKHEREHLQQEPKQPDAFGEVAYDHTIDGLLSGGEWRPLDKPIAVKAGDTIRFYTDQQGKRQIEVQPKPPKEPRYRRKPLEWTERISEFNKPYWHAESPFGDCRIDEWVPGRCFLLWWESMKEDPTIEQAKARVEAEITRRLASVLEVVND